MRKFCSFGACSLILVGVILYQLRCRMEQVWVGYASAVPDFRTAAAVDARLSSGEDAGPLAGAIVAIKDNICTTAGRTTCSSRMLAEYRSPYEATAVERLRAAGAIPLGRTNLDEFAMGSSSENCAWGPVRNPHDPDRVPGGSSGGSATAVAADCCDAALGIVTGTLGECFFGKQQHGDPAVSQTQGSRQSGGTAANNKYRSGFGRTHADAA